MARKRTDRPLRVSPKSTWVGLLARLSLVTLPFLAASTLSSLTVQILHPVSYLSLVKAPPYWLAFASWRDGSGEIYLMNADGSKIRQMIGGRSGRRDELTVASEKVEPGAALNLRSRVYRHYELVQYLARAAALIVPGLRCAAPRMDGIPLIGYDQLDLKDASAAPLINNAMDTYSSCVQFLNGGEAFLMLSLPRFVGYIASRTDEVSVAVCVACA